MEIPIVGGAYLGRSRNLNSQICQNLYPILGGEGGKKVVALANTPGLGEFASLGVGEIRALDVMGDYIYAVKGNQLYKVASDGSSTLMSGTLNTSRGKVWMRNNGSQIMIVDNPYGYVLGEIKASGVLTFSGQPSDGETVTIDTKTYTFRTTLTPTEGEVLIGSIASATIINFYNAINHDTGAGVTYKCEDEHPSVEGAISEETTLTVRARIGGTGGNSIVTTETCASLSWATATLMGGANEVTLQLISDEDFPAASSLTFQDGYFIVTRTSTGRFYLSNSYDGRLWDALDYATAEADPDNLVGCISSSRLLWLIGVKSYEVWFNSGDAIFPFDRIDGSFNNIGCEAANSIAEFQGTVAWLDHNKNVRASQGYSAQKISTEQIDYQIGQYTITSDATGYFYSQEGHVFYVLTFPTEEKTWVYDFTTQLWHTRASNNTDLRHRANCYASFNGMGIVGDYENGKLYKYDLTKYSDDGVMLRRIRTAQAITENRKNIFHGTLELEFEAGVGLTVDDPILGVGKDPVAILQWSDDGGHVWSNEHWTAIGKIGEYKKRAIWRKLGRSRDRIYRITITDPVKTVIIGAYLDAT